MNRSNLPLAVELLVSPDARRERVTVETHEGFRRSITTPQPAPFDLVDELVAEALNQVEVAEL